MKTTAEIAEGIVQKVVNAEEMLGTSSEDITAVISREIPLLELLEVARAADADRGVVTALTELKKKLPEL